MLLILVSLIGNGIGPYFVGFMSDFFMSRELAVTAAGAELTPALCNARDAVLSEAQVTVCGAANSAGLKMAMSVTVCWFILAAACFMVCARTLKRDFVAELGGD